MRNLILASVLITLAGCVTMMQGTSQGVAISSNPTGAMIRVNGEQKGITPAVLDLSRKGNHLVSLQLDGYQPYEAALSKQVSGWVVGNILFGGLVGLAVDAISGGLYKITPETISGTLGHGSALIENTDDVLVIQVVLEVDPSWEKIGQMARATD